MSATAKISSIDKITSDSPVARSDDRYARGWHVLDAYCPHMGADLSKGCVRSNSIVCPFHAWVWGRDGQCEDIPYAKRIPAKAKIKA